MVKVAERWLRSFGCSIVVTEMVTVAMETPDAIGFRNQMSIMVECKTSMADFRADAKKFHRLHPETGMGNYRFFMCEDGLIPEADVPLGWGLLYIQGKKVKKIRGLHGNCGATENGVFCFDASLRAERTLLLSILRRLQSE